MCSESWLEPAAPHTSAPFIPSALSLLRCPFSLHALCSLGRLRSEPSRPPSHPPGASPCPPSLIVTRCPRCPVYCQVMWDSRPHQILVHLLHLLQSGVRCWGGGMCVGLGVRSTRTSQAPSSGLGGEGSSDIMVCRQTAATSHHNVNDPISH